MYRAYGPAEHQNRHELQALTQTSSSDNALTGDPLLKHRF